MSRTGCGRNSLSELSRPQPARLRTLSAEGGSTLGHLRHTEEDARVDHLDGVGYPAARPVGVDDESTVFVSRCDTDEARTEVENLSNRPSNDFDLVGDEEEVRDNAVTDREAQRRVGRTHPGRCPSNSDPAR